MFRDHVPGTLALALVNYFIVVRFFNSFIGFHYLYITTYVETFLKRNLKNENKRKKSIIPNGADPNGPMQGTAPIDHSPYVNINRK